jgi:hypothetical protein
MIAMISDLLASLQSIDIDLYTILDAVDKDSSPTYSVWVDMHFNLFGLCVA